MQFRHSAVIIPTFNPSQELVGYVNSLIESGFRKVIVVNDGSNSECEPIFDQIKKLPECEVLAHAVNLGKGRGLKDAFNYYLVNYQSDYDGVITVDSDGQHAVEDVARVDDQIQKEEDTLVLGARDFNDDSVPFKSSFGNKVTKVVIRLLWGGAYS